jgi:hypothetical protein
MPKRIDDLRDAMMLNFNDWSPMASPPAPTKSATPRSRRCTASLPDVATIDELLQSQERGEKTRVSS